MTASYNITDRNSGQIVEMGGALREAVDYKVALNAVKLREES